MLRYYTYYSIGGYKDLYLGSSEDKLESTYYLPLLSVLKENSATDETARNEYYRLSSLPAIHQLSDKENFNLPTSASPIFSHAGYKIIYRHIEGDVHALALRDITSGAKDEMGRKIPFLIVFTADTIEDVLKLNVITAYIASNLHQAEQSIASFLGYDIDKNGLRFKLAEFNAWINQILDNDNSTKIVTRDGVITIRGEKDSVALLALPSGINLSYAVIEQNLVSNEIKSVDMNKIINKTDVEQIISQLETTSEELNYIKSLYSKLKKNMIVVGIICFILGAIIF